MRSNQSVKLPEHFGHRVIRYCNGNIVKNKEKKKVSMGIELIQCSNALTFMSCIY